MVDFTRSVPGTHAHPLYLAQLGRLDENKLQKTLGRSSALPYETATNDLFRENPSKAAV
jgi:hypothetical protein